MYKHTFALWYIRTDQIKSSPVFIKLNVDFRWAKILGGTNLSWVDFTCNRIETRSLVPIIGVLLKVHFHMLLRLAIKLNWSCCHLVSQNVKRKMTRLIIINSTKICDWLGAVNGAVFVSILENQLLECESNVNVYSHLDDDREECTD